jgi:surface antigen
MIGRIFFFILSQNGIIDFYQEKISRMKKYRCAHAECSGGESCSAYAKKIISEMSLSKEDKLEKINKRLKECKEKSIVAGLGNLSGTWKMFLQYGIIGAVAFSLTGCLPGGRSDSTSQQSAPEPTGLNGAIGDNTSSSELDSLYQIDDGRGSSGLSGAPKCGGESSDGNPYRCCSTKGLTYDDAIGNCVWYAWKAAKDNMGLSLPKWGDAGQWLSGAKTYIKNNPDADFIVQTSPVANAIGIKVKGDYGHVAYINSVNADGSVNVTEQNCPVPGIKGTGTQTEKYEANFFSGYIAKKNASTPVSPVVSGINIGYSKVGASSVFDVYGSNFTPNVKFTIVNPHYCTNPIRQIGNSTHIQWSCTIGDVSGQAIFRVLDAANGYKNLSEKSFMIEPNQVTNTAPVISGFNISGQNGRAFGSFSVSDSENDTLTKIRVHVSTTYDGSGCQIDPLSGGYNGTSKPGDFSFDTVNSTNNCVNYIQNTGTYYAKVEAWDSSLQAQKVFSQFSISSNPPPSNPPSVSGVQAYNFNVGQNKIYSGLYSYNNTIIVVSGNNLPTTAVVDVQGLSCNVLAPVTAAALWQTGTNFSTAENSASGKYTYPNSTGYSNGFASVCSGAAMSTGKTYTATVKSAPNSMGGTSIGGSYQFRVN